MQSLAKEKTKKGTAAFCRQIRSIERKATTMANMMRAESTKKFSSMGGWKTE